MTMNKIKSILKNSHRFQNLEFIFFLALYMFPSLRALKEHSANLLRQTLLSTIPYPTTSYECRFLITYIRVTHLAVIWCLLFVNVIMSHVIVFLWRTGLVVNVNTFKTYLHFYSILKFEATRISQHSYVT